MRWIAGLLALAVVAHGAPQDGSKYNCLFHNRSHGLFTASYTRVISTVAEKFTPHTFFSKVNTVYTLIKVAASISIKSFQCDLY